MPTSGEQWHYIVNGQKQGPVDHNVLLRLIADGHVTHATLLWREGMPDWQPASAALGISTGAGMAPMPPETLALEQKQKTAKNARQNCIVMFVLLLGMVLLFLIMIVAEASGVATRDVTISGVFTSLLPCLGLASGVFAAIYVPLRWRQIKDLPRNIRLLGLIGGFGLIAILVICLAAGGISFYLWNTTT